MLEILKELQFPQKYGKLRIPGHFFQECNLAISTKSRNNFADDYKVTFGGESISKSITFNSLIPLKEWQFLDKTRSSQARKQPISQLASPTN